MTVDPENVTVICDRHRRKVAASPDGPGVVHVGGNVAAACDSQRFLVRREQAVTRQDVIPVLAARAEKVAERRRSLRELANGIGGTATG